MIIDKAILLYHRHHHQEGVALNIIISNHARQINIISNNNADIKIHHVHRIKVDLSKETQDSKTPPVDISNGVISVEVISRVTVSLVAIQIAEVSRVVEAINATIHLAIIVIIKDQIKSPAHLHQDMVEVTRVTIKF